MKKFITLQLLPYVADAQDSTNNRGMWVWPVGGACRRQAGPKNIYPSCRRRMSNHHLLVAKFRLG